MSQRRDVQVATSLWPLTGGFSAWQRFPPSQPRRRFEGYDPRVRRALVIGALATTVLAGSPGQAVAAFSPNLSWQTDGAVRAIAFAHGVIYIGGQFSAVRPPGTAVGSGRSVARSNVAAFDATTGAPLNWHPRVGGTVYSIAVSGSRVYLGGAFTSVGGAVRDHLAAVSTAGGLTGWNPHADSTVNVVRIGPNGNVFVGGRFGRIGGVTRSRVAEITPAGSLTAWAPRVAQLTGFACPPRCKPVVFAIAFSPAGRSVYLGGHFGLVNDVARNEAAAVPLSDGSAVLGFNPDIYAPANCVGCTTPETSRVYQMIVTNSRVYTCGGYWRVNGSRRSFNVSAFDPDTGAIDPSFTVQDDGDTPGCALRGGVLYVGGHFNFAGPDCQPTHLEPCAIRHHVAAIDTVTSTLLPWNPGANSNHGLLVIEAGIERVAFGGYMTRMGGIDQEGLAVYRAPHLP